MTDTKKAKNNIFGCILTDVAPASLYRGETQASRSILQKLTFPDKESYTVISAEAIRNRLREMLLEDVPEKVNRLRLKDRKQLTVMYQHLPDAAKHIDDLLFGFLMIDTKKSEEATAKQWDTILRVNYAVSLDPFPRHNNKTMHQSPNIEGAFSNASSSAIIEREVHVTAYQYPFGLNLIDLTKVPGYEQSTDVDKAEKKRWVALLLGAISELSFPAGNHARTMFPFGPVSIVLRLTSRRTPDFDLYGFKPDSTRSHSELFSLLKENQLQRDEFYIGGRIARENKAELKEYGAFRDENGKPKEGRVNLFETSAQAIEALIQDSGLLPEGKSKQNEKEG